jgi:predicted PurR-regulated permease PerM
VNQSPETGASAFAIARRVLIGTLVVLAVAGVVLLVVYAADLLLLVFTGILVSIPLRRLRRFVHQKTGFGDGVSLALVTVVLFGLIAGLVVLTAGRIGTHATEFVAQVRSAFDTLLAGAQQHAWLSDALERLPSLGEVLLGSNGALSRLTGIASSTLGGLINATIAVIVGIYLASQPELYSSGLKHLLPFRARRRAGEVLRALDQALGRWLMGRLLLMVINGTVTSVALWALGVPLALTLGVLAGVLNFIPNFGPFIAAIPAVLLAWTVDLRHALYTVAVYILVQMVDGYVLTPVVDRRSVELPPVITLSAQLLLGVLFGFVGLLVASPLTACVMILVRMLYVEDVLGDPITRDGHIQRRPGT